MLGTMYLLDSTVCLLFLCKFVLFMFSVPIFSVKPFLADFYNLFLCCAVTLIFQVRGGFSVHKAVNSCLVDNYTTSSDFKVHGGWGGN